ncbi:1516_t:CDS:2, partial [Funneliformis caledonium]
MGLHIYEENSSTPAQKMTTITLTEFQGYDIEKLIKFLESEEEFFEIKGGPAKSLSKYTIKLKNEPKQVENQLDYDYTDYDKNIKKSSPLILNDFRTLKEGAQ